MTISISAAAAKAADSTWRAEAYVERENQRRAAEAKAEGQLGYIDAGAIGLAARAFAGTDLKSHLYVGTDPGMPDATAIGCLANSSGASLVGYVGGGTEREWRFTHTDGTHFVKVDPAPGESYAAWAMKCAEEAERNRAAAQFFECAAPIVETEWGSIQVVPASPENRAARVSDLVKITINVATDGGDWWAVWQRRVTNELLGIVESDEPGIAAMAAKNVQPIPEPVLSVGGEQVTEREIAQALQLLRGQNAPAVKETPRGLLCVREGFDHRLSAWNEA